MRSSADSPAKQARVLLLVENNAYPFDVRVCREAQALFDAGYAVTVIAPRARGQAFSESVNGVSVLRFPAPPGGRGVMGYAFEFAYATAAMLLLSIWVSLRQGFDVIHAANPPDTLFVIGAVFKLFGKKFVFDQHDLSPQTYLSRFKEARPNAVFRVLELLERCTFAVADVVIATNESYRHVALERGRKNPEQVFVVRNGPPLSYSAWVPDAALQRRAQHLIGYIGTMGPQDGVDCWLRSVREMVFTLGRSDFLAVVIGSGDAAPALHTLAHELKIEEYVWFTGRISDVDARTYLSTVSVCVQPDPLNPLNDKSTMNKVMEYMALGKPVVAFDLVETRVSAGEAGLFATPNDELEFANKVCWLLDHPEQARRLGALGRERVVSQLSWEHSVPHLLRAYSEGLGLRPIAPTDAFADRAPDLATDRSAQSLGTPP
jgi:glycosyltransferase involved in cell wall biosynthesis